MCCNSKKLWEKDFLMERISCDNFKLIRICGNTLTQKSNQTFLSSASLYANK